MTAIPEVPQYLAALSHGNDIRKGMADIKRNIRSLPPRESATLAADIIEGDLDDVTGSLRIRPLLSCVRRLGDVKVTRCLVNARVVNSDRRLRELTQRQRMAAAVQLRLWAEDIRPRQ